MNNFWKIKTKVKVASEKKTVIFFILVLLLSIPFMVIGAITGIELMPGLPIAAFSTICPMLAALFLAYWENRKKGMLALLKRAFDYKRIKAKIWYIPILLLMPFVMLLSFWVIRLTGTPIPAPMIKVLPALILCVLFFLGALGEELGWSGYVTDPMQNRIGALLTGIILGLVWAVYHYIGLIQAHRSITWIIWWSLGTIVMRMILVWIYNNTGKSVFATALFHMTINVTWQLFPINGSYYDPCITSLILALITIIIIVFYNPQSFARKYL